MRFLVIENDKAQADLIKKPLLHKGYIVDVVLDGEQGLAYVETFSYDVLLINVDLPKIDGIALCSQIREKGYIMPILLLKAEDSNIDRVTCLEARADDLLVRPSTRKELFARIRALVNSPQKLQGSPLESHGLSLDPESRKVTYQDQAISLSYKEYSLLELFLRNPKRVLSQTTILEHLWSFQSQPNDNTVRAHIKRLRKKLKTVEADHLLETVYGFGYRLKPLSQQPSESHVKSTPTSKADNPSKIRSVDSVNESPKATDFETGREKLKTKIFNRFQTLEETITAAQTSSFTPELCQDAEIQAHKLAGLLGILGLKSEYRLAQQIEQGFVAVRQSPQTPISIQPLTSLLAELHQQLQPLKPLDEKNTANFDPLLISQPPTATLSNPEYRVLVVDDDLELTQELQRVALNWNLQLDITPTLEQARVILRQTSPDLVLLDLVFPDSQNGGFILLEELKQEFPGLPVLVWTVRDQISTRAAVSRLGGNTFLSKSVSCDQVLEAIKDILKSTPTASAKILAVDDDSVTLNFLQELLSSYDLEVTPLADPRLFWQTLEQTGPDLLILDGEMPYFEGRELCQMVRNDRMWNTLPILFLSARQDLETVQKIYQAGADDYIFKPFAEAELVTRIFNRLERIHLLRSLAETEPITGLANRRRSSSDLNRYLHLSERHGQPFCLGLITLDHFQSINHQYGYRVGDNVRRQFGQILQHQFRDEDIVADWGGEAFLVGLYSSNPVDAQKRISKLLNLVENTVFPINTYVQIQITGSAGISSYPKDANDLPSLYEASYTALSRAKAAGGNCCLTTAH